MMKIGTIFRNWKILSISFLGMVMLLIQLPTVMAVEDHSGDQILLELALHKISLKYDVHFNYDRDIMKDVMVDYEENNVFSLAEALDHVFENTHFGYRVFEQRYIVVFENNDEGTESLKNMINHMQDLVQERESVKKRNIQPVNRLSTFTTKSLYHKRIVFSVSGMVTDDAGEPLIGVNIQVKGSNKGTATDFDGKFILEDIDENAVLVISYVGYQTQEIPVAGKSRLEIVMISDSQLLDEVVVVGYGTRSKALNTSSISSLKAEDLELNSSTKQVGELLQGKSTGVMVRNVSGAPDQEPVIRIRGMNSILGNNSALIVVDGFQRGSLRDINPQDIESIDILKGANATAIYGSEGANGVIVVTTKEGSGKSLQPELSFKMDASTGRLGKKLPKISAANWAKRVNAIELAENLDRTPTPVFTAEDILRFEEDGGYDWQDIITRDAFSQNYSLSIQGASAATNYRISGSIYNNEGIIVDSDYKRYTLHARFNSEIADWASIGVNIGLNSDGGNHVNSNTQTDNPIHGALTVPPIMPIHNESGDYFGLGDASETKWSKYGPEISSGNPLAMAKEVTQLSKGLNNSVFGFLLINPTKNISLRSELGVRQNQFSNRNFYNNNTFAGKAANGRGGVTDNTSQYIQNSNIITYKNLFNNHSLEVSAIYEQKFNEFYGTSINNTDFPVHSTTFFNLGSADIQRSSSNHSESKIISYVGRITYNYARKYFISGSYRSDGASVFGDKNKWSSFPSGSIGWKLSEEEFLQSSNIFQNVMLRASYGWTGNQAIGPYQTLASVGLVGEYPYRGGETTTLGYGINRASNPRLKWETTEQRDIGIDVALFNGRLEINFDYYYKLTRDLLQSREIASSSGLSTITDNVGKLSNEGIEISFSHSLQRGFFRMHNNFNFSNNKTVVLDLGGVERLGYSAGGAGASVNDPLIYLFEGERWGSIYGWKYEGTWKLDEEEQAKQYGQLPGDQKFLDYNGDGVIDSRDRVFLGNVIPNFEFGFSNQFGYKNFELSFQIQGAYGNKIFNVTRSKAIFDDEWENRWLPDNQTDVPSVGYWDAVTAREKLENYPNKISIPTTMRQAHSRWIEDGSYARLRYLTLSYNLPPNILNNIKIQNISLFLSFKNLFTLTQYSGYNPEVSSFSDDKTLGTSFFDYPVPREYSFGMNINL